MKLPQVRVFASSRCQARSDTSLLTSQPPSRIIRKLLSRRGRQRTARCLRSDCEHRARVQLTGDEQRAGEVGMCGFAFPLVNACLKADEVSPYPLFTLLLASCSWQDEFICAALNRPALGSFPPVKWTQWLKEGLLTAQPKGLDQLITTLCGSSANGEQQEG